MEVCLTAPLKRCPDTEYRAALEHPDEGVCVYTVWVHGLDIRPEAERPSRYGFEAMRGWERMAWDASDMRVKVLFFGMLKDVAGRASDAVELRAGATVGELLSHYERQFPGLKPLLPSVALSLNQEYTALDAELHANDEVGLLPPVSGGSGAQSDHAGPSKLARGEGPESSQVRGTEHARIVREPIETQPVLDTIKKPEDGAAIVFEGIVRNNTRGRRTLYLEYEAYEEMALKQMEGLAGEALGKFGVRDVALVHRLGRLEIGETSVLIVVAAAHRAAAFEASRWLIDTLKRTVPIWKKEFFVDGAVWADGEPFPAEIPRAEGSPSVGTASK